MSGAVWRVAVWRCGGFERMASAWLATAAWGGGKTPHHSRSSISQHLAWLTTSPRPSPLLPVETELSSLLYEVSERRVIVMSFGSFVASDQH